MSSEKYKNRKYSIVPYNPSWKDEFEAISLTLKDIFGPDALAIEHVGSSSIPGMSGKPTIDVMVVVHDLGKAKLHKEEMEKLGYEFLIDFIKPKSYLFRKMEDNVVFANIHVFLPSDSHVKEMLGFRDYMRNHPDEVKVYSNLKLELYSKFPNDYASYRKFKDEYVGKLNKKISYDLHA